MLAYGGLHLAAALFLLRQNATPFCKAGAGTQPILAVGSMFQDISLLDAKS